MNAKYSKIIWLCFFGASLALGLAIVLLLKGFKLPTAIDIGPVDTSWTTRTIVGLFLLTLVVNAHNTLMIMRQAKLARRGLRPDPHAHQWQLVGEGLLGLHAARMLTIYGRHFDGEVSQQVSLGVIRNGLHGQEWFVRTSSQLLLTLGLIGTVIGLTNSMEGLSTAMLTMNGESDRGDSFVNGMEQALGGMATAFGTTLFGAILGGICLRVLSGCTEHLAEELVDEIEITTETQLIPLMRGSLANAAARQRDSLDFLDKVANLQQQRFNQLADQLEDLFQQSQRQQERFATVRE